ncbi:TrmH family RNA methyltransferase [Rubinisphaera margarita]|uniref:TrmH family RNA methyltransferase n=1 Tax=Rubinisphaera margarita TaxID=2909586 RepID=UPI001EE7B9F9|nr:RNA methyltransferase [Rubinisphaera margarita]MCG6155200.1 RNA methyltransferase [Rubinisphaera margarita]
MPRGRGSSARPLLSNHQKSWLWGTLCVEETLRAGQWPIYELLLATESDQPIHRQIVEHAERLEIPIDRQPARRLEQLCKARDHQGVLALMGPFPYTSLARFEQQLTPQSRIVVLDRLQDPFNFGAIVRSAAAFGMTGIVIGAENQVQVNSHVARSSVGLVNRIPIVRVESLGESLRTLQQAGCRFIAARQDGEFRLGELFAETDFAEHPLAMILGSEAHGVSAELDRLCNGSVRIDMAEGVESLNAAVTAGILMYSLSPLTNLRSES